MLRLLLLRHAKAAPHDLPRDFERAIIERGRSDAERVGRFIAAQKPAVEAAVHSGARRAKETLKIVCSLLPKGLPVLIEPRLYEATASDFIKALRGMPESYSCVLLVGHNPSLGEAAARLAGKGERAALLSMAAKFPTSGLAILEFEGRRWSELSERSGRLVAFVTPGSLEGP
jgi:phosphohistidine phosphatase